MPDQVNLDELYKRKGQLHAQIEIAQSNLRQINGQIGEQLNKSMAVNQPKKEVGKKDEGKV